MPTFLSSGSQHSYGFLTGSHQFSGAGVMVTSTFMPTFVSALVIGIMVSMSIIPMPSGAVIMVSPFSSRRMRFSFLKSMK